MPMPRAQRRLAGIVVPSTQVQFRTQKTLRVRLTVSKSGHKRNLSVSSEAGGHRVSCAFRRIRYCQVIYVAVSGDGQLQSLHQVGAKETRARSLSASKHNVRGLSSPETLSIIPIKQMLWYVRFSSVSSLQKRCIAGCTTKSRDVFVTSTNCQSIALSVGIGNDK